MTNNTIPIAIAGSTQQTQKCAQALAQSNQFKIQWILTPRPKETGREKKTKPNPFLQWSQTETDHFFLVNNKINQTLKSKIQKLNQTQPVEILLVVDFGYIIPDWLLQIPTTASVNIHPSDLPRWRGSSPGQLVLLTREQKSAVTLIKLNNKLDQGPIIGKIPFEVNNTWNHQDYYDYSFKLMADKLPTILREFIKNPKQTTPQPKKSPTPIARKITKDDAFVPWDLVASFLSQKQRANYQIKTQLTQTLQLFPEKSLLKDRLEAKPKEIWPDLIERASRAFSPWPLLWTKLPTRKNQRRMQLLSCELSFNPHAKDKNKKKLLKLNEVRIAGQSQAQWNQVKNILG
jgi:methionyl-tRNA formyltransferase